MARLVHRWSEHKASTKGRTIWYCEKCELRLDTRKTYGPADLVAGRELGDGRKLKTHERLPTCRDADGNQAPRETRTKFRHQWNAVAVVAFEGRDWQVFNCPTCDMNLAIPAESKGMCGRSRRYRYGSDGEWIFATNQSLPICKQRHEHVFMREHYVAKGQRFCADALKLSIPAVSKLAMRLGLRRSNPWTDKQRADLQWGWASHEMMQKPEAGLLRLCKKLNHTRDEVLNEVGRLGLGVSCPNGWEFVATAADRTGFSTDVLKKVLAHSGVQIRPAIRRNHGERPMFIVEIERVTDAVAAWCLTDNPGMAAARIGMDPRVLDKALFDIGIVRPAKVKIRAWRVLSADIDRAVALYTSKVSVGAYAREHDIGRIVLIHRLKINGHEPTKEQKAHWMLPRATLDAVMESRCDPITSSTWALDNNVHRGTVAMALERAGHVVAPGRRRVTLPRYMIDEVMASVAINKRNQRSPEERAAEREAIEARKLERETRAAQKLAEKEARQLARADKAAENRAREEAKRLERERCVAAKVLRDAQKLAEKEARQLAREQRAAAKAINGGKRERRARVEALTISALSFDGYSRNTDMALAETG